MPRNENPIEKSESLGHVVKVQQVIDFIVLSDLINGQRYHSEMEQFIIQTLGGVGVNDAYFSNRLKALQRPDMSRAIGTVITGTIDIIK